MKKKISIIDYRVGNIKSIINSVSFFDVEANLTSDAKEIENSDAIILPGVGSYSHGMGNLKKLELDKIILNYANSQKPIMGICLGMQLLMEESEEFGKTKGLGLIKGKVKKIKCNKGYSIPHIGWEEVIFNDRENLSNGQDFFFCHSYVAIPTHQEQVLATSIYGGNKFCSVVGEKNIVGFQFHPEKSGQNGLYLVKKFINSVNKEV